MMYDAIDSNSTRDDLLKIANVLRQENEELKKYQILHQETETKLRDNVEYYKNYFQYAPHGVFILNSNGQFIDVNDYTVRVSGYSKEELLTKSPPDLFSPLQKEANSMHFSRLLNNGKTSGEVLIRKKDGGDRYFSVDAVKINNSQYIGFCVEITADKLAENALKESEYRYRALVEASHDIIFQIDLEANFIFINSAVKEILGYSIEEIKEINAISLVHPDDLDLVTEKLNMLISGEPVKDLEYRYKKKDGTYVSLHTNNSPIFDLDGKIVYLYGVARDSTERLQALEKLKESEERFRILADATFEGLVISHRGKIIDTNKTFLNMIECSKEELQGTPVVDLIAPEHRKMVSKQIQTGHQKPFEHRLICRNGKVLEVEVRPRKIIYQGKGSRLTAIRDITEQKSLESQLRQSQKMEALGTLAGGIAHDFNNKLGVIIGYTELSIESFPEDGMTKKMLRHVLSAAERAQDMVQQILSFCRQTDLIKEPVLVANILSESLKLIRSSLPTTIEIRVHIGDNLRSVLANPTQIHQIVMNLCTNAAYAMRDNGGLLEIDLSNVDISDENKDLYSGLTSGTYIRLSVTDNGEGIPKNIQNRIFDPFFTTKKAGEGTGMGLAVLHGIVKNYGGDVIVQSKVGKGTAFHILLPEMSEYVIVKKDTPLPIPRGKENVFMVDDEYALVNLGKQILEMLGYKVTISTDSKKALNTFKVNPKKFDLVITDMTMPNMTGIQLAKEMLKIQPDIPVILCTGYSEKVDDEIAKNAGIKEFVMKPLTKNDFAYIVRRVLDN
jgi:PAS domain S-box-containing protein